jgi:hypothetical protein
MTGTAAELHGRLAEAEELERAIDAGQFSTLIDFRTALQQRMTKMHSDLLALSAINAMLTPMFSGDVTAINVPRVLH